MIILVTSQFVNVLQNINNLTLLIHMHPRPSILYKYTIFPSHKDTKLKQALDSNKLLYQNPKALKFFFPSLTMKFNFFSQTPILVFLLLATFTTLSLAQGTRVGFYSRTCPRVESIVQATVRRHFGSDPTIAPGLLRMIFHDCFVQGCDASILIAGASTERTAGPNLLLRGYEVIDDAKTQLEAECPGVVSCADILAIAARDSVVVVILCLSCII